MADPHHPAPGNQGPAKTPGYEIRDANTRAIMYGGIILTAVVVFSFVYMRWLFNHYQRSIARERPPVSELTEQQPIPPAPRLRVNAVKELTQLHAYEDGLLQGYQWVQKDAGIAHIPIARAMAIVAERGLPVWPAAVPADTNIVSAVADAGASNAPAAAAAAPSGGAP
ncbi:MAG: hypothetical protein K8T26_04380 [Lentisphaerae bacterium]|nr:hypothetical protein [Lentisphaerota bacterium]